MQTTFETRKGRVQQIRQRARQLFEAGAPGVQIASVICSNSEAVLMDFAEEARRELSLNEQELARQGAIVGVGGTGRGELSPYSDIDLLFLVRSQKAQAFREFSSRLMQYCWDAGFVLGHSVREVGECISLSLQDAQIATSLVEARRLWGARDVYSNLVRKFWNKVVKSRQRQFIEDCIAARSENWREFGPTAQELEPDVKSSAGGLRDLHLIRWIGFACCQRRDIDELRLENKLSKDDARTVKNVWDYLTRLRIDLHLSAGKAQDKLTRDEQLRIATARGFKATASQRPVELFMRDYFRHSSELAVITRRFVSLHRPRSFMSVARDMLVSHRAENVLSVGPERIDVKPRNLSKVCENLESILHYYKTCALYGLPPAPRVTDEIRRTVPKLPSIVTPTAAALFLDILKLTKPLGMILRAMFDTWVLDLVIPDFTHIRSLMQFNQYHHFTVDEHTIRAVEAATALERDDSPLGTAYRVIKHRHLLHLALILHDIGKGFERDHSIVGKEISEKIGCRLHLPSHQTELIALLVHKHLVMGDVAWRRDITDEKQLFSFSQEIGSPDALRMLYLLTAADVTAVGPGAWTGWKASLLTELFDRCLVILSGRRYTHHEQQRMAAVRDQVVGLLKAQGMTFDDIQSGKWLKEQLDGFSAYYLTCTPAEIIASDIARIRTLTDEAIEVMGHFDPGTRTTEYRVITRNPTASEGCFHKMAGALTAKHLSILSADINTTKSGVIVDSYRVLDKDYEGEPPEHRVQEVAGALRAVLRGETTVEKLFRRHRKYGGGVVSRGISNLSTRVRIDSESSDSRLIIDIFAHDRPGLLYTVTKELYDLGLSVDLAKIATNFDQVVDVFYVREESGRPVRGEDRINSIRSALVQRLEEFDTEGHKDFLT